MTSPEQSISDPESSTSPTPTIRNTPAQNAPSVIGMFDQPTTENVEDNTAENRKVSGARAQQELGKGRPGGGELVSDRLIYIS